MRTGLVVALVALLLAPVAALAQGSGGAAAASSQVGRWYFDASIGPAYFANRRDFTFGAEQGPFFTPVIRNIVYDEEGPGAAWTATAGFWLREGLGVEAGVTGAWQFRESWSRCTSGAQMEFPLIKGGTAITGLGAVDFDCGGGSVFKSRMDYDQSLFDVHLDTRLSFSRSADGRSALEGVVGVGYVSLTQTIEHRATGHHLGNPEVLETNVDLADRMFGLRLGVRGRQALGSRFGVTGSLIGSGYFRHSNLDADQRASNVSLDCCTPATTTFRIWQTDTNNGFVPRVEASVGMTYALNRMWDLGLVYRFDGLWNLASTNTQQISPCPTTTCFADKNMKLHDGDKLLMHILSLAIIGRF